ncbi:MULTISPECIES: hypothetical protein [unclassified Oleiphilus]|uniref:hypothetical protein n=1 Tax=unclassified Oleiphilus TaxID=2631174 RepID=UPI0007C39717|nr:MULTISPECIES: hypothetical protein [unclassified Oleiphilus]KZY38609.1 hypothetical protein A3729_15855 [Oleiphilus sp. HI0043]KZZ66674.1 hypothetical protein A3763_16980 [Oleiphilus sp. HI0128]
MRQNNSAAAPTIKLLILFYIVAVAGVLIGILGIIAYITMLVGLLFDRAQVSLPTESQMGPTKDELDKIDHIEGSIKTYTAKAYRNLEPVEQLILKLQEKKEELTSKANRIKEEAISNGVSTNKNGSLSKRSKAGVAATDKIKELRLEEEKLIIEIAKARSKKQITLDKLSSLVEKLEGEINNIKKVVHLRYGDYLGEIDSYLNILIKRKCFVIGTFAAISIWVVCVENFRSEMVDVSAWIMTYAQLSDLWYIPKTFFSDILILSVGFWGTFYSSFYVYSKLDGEILQKNKPEIFSVVSHLYNGNTIEKSVLGN